ncbi:MAG: cytochrome c [Bacteroidia bacterium]|jgi:nitrite reductase (NO-forming)|nr:cytochrome c [Bacteroidia bacterium]
MNKMMLKISTGLREAGMHPQIIPALAGVVISVFAACNGSNGSSGSTAGATASTDGKTIYQKTCVACHNSDGMGAPGMYPPLAKSDFLLADKYRAIRQLLKGSSTPVTVNGTSYTGMMPPQPLSDEEAAQVLNYVYHAWGNNGFTLNAADIKAVRDTLK